MNKQSWRQVAVIGGGWAGCAAAVELARRGIPVTLIEAARTLGGRARRVEINGLGLDNGQHILLGAYSETLRLLRLVGISEKAALIRIPLQMRYPAGGMDFLTPRLPAPLHMVIGLLRARGLQPDDKMSLARFSTTARWMGWRLDTDCSVSELLKRFDQTDRLIQLMWRPLCIAALNTPPERASAQVFLNVLRDSLGARRAASDMLLPRVDLSELFPAAAAAYIETRGGKVVLGKAVSAVRRGDDGWELDIGTGNELFDAVVVAIQPVQAAGLLNTLIDTRVLTGLAYEPITTCYLQYGPQTRLEQPFLALIDDAAAGAWGQFVFDRGQLDARQAGLFSVVISASTEAVALDQDVLVQAVADQLTHALQRPELAAPLWTKVISEKRATFSCTPGLDRPDNDTGIDGLLLAGDYTAGEYPATLESAVRSGVQAANALHRTPSVK